MPGTRKVPPVFLLSFKRLLLLTRVQLRAALCRQGCQLVVAEQRNGERKSAKGCRLWKLLLCRSAKKNKRDYIKVPDAVPQLQPTRAAGKGSKNFHQGIPILGVRSCAQDGGGLQRQQPRRLSKKPSGSGVPRGVPLVSFLATSWGMPRSSRLAQRGALCRAQGQKAKPQTTFPFDAHA